MHEKRADERFVGNKDSFLLLTLVGASKGFENVDTGGSSGDYIMYSVIIYEYQG